MMYTFNNIMNFRTCRGRSLTDIKQFPAVLPFVLLHDHINCFWVGETHAQLRLECGSYIVRARSLTKLATSTPDQECDCLANPVANFIDNIILVIIHVDFPCLDYNLIYGEFRPNSIIKSTCTLVVPAGIEPATRGFSVPCSTDWATEPWRGPNLTRTGDIEINSLSF